MRPQLAEGFARHVDVCLRVMGRLQSTFHLAGKATMMELSERQKKPGDLCLMERKHFPLLPRSRHNRKHASTSSPTPEDLPSNTTRGGGALRRRTPLHNLVIKDMLEVTFGKQIDATQKKNKKTKSPEGQRSSCAYRAER